MVRDTQDNGSNAVEGDTKDDSSVTNRQQAGSNDTPSEDQLDSDILLPETNEYEAYYYD
jgi:hypothetical protein